MNITYFFMLFVLQRLDMARDPQFIETPSPSLTLFWNPSCGKPGAGIEQRIQICSVVDVVLSALPEPTKYMVRNRFIMFLLT